MGDSVFVILRYFYLLSLHGWLFEKRPYVITNARSTDVEIPFLPCLYPLYRKPPNISPGLMKFLKPFLMGLYIGGGGGGYTDHTVGYSKKHAVYC